MLLHVNLTPEEIANLPVSEIVDREWLKIIAYQLAKLNEQVDLITPLPFVNRIPSKPQDNTRYPKRVKPPTGGGNINRS